MSMFGAPPQGQVAPQHLGKEQAGEDAGEIIVKDPAFKNVATGSEDRLRVSNPWPKDSLPPTTASLLSIASNKGLAAYATPEALCMVSTEKARVRYLMRRKEGEKPTQSLEPDVKLSVPRISHVAFSSDEQCLVIAAEQGGGLAVYDANSLSSSSQPAFQISTNGTSVRHLLPNPSISGDLAHLFGVVLTDGKLLLANLKSRDLIKTQGGTPVFYENVSCAAWSKMGKQLIAGLADGSATQMDTMGSVKDRVPQPPQLAQLHGEYEGATGLPITSISWITNFEFLLIYSPTYPSPKSEDDIRQEDSLYFYAKRNKTEPFTFHKFDLDPCTPFGMTDRAPSQHFVQRIVDWGNIADLLVVSSTTSTDVGLFGRLKDTQGGQILTITVDEERNGRASVPVSEESQDETSTIGMALDFSTKEVAPAPIPNLEDAYPHSGIPLPAMYVLTTDGILLMWWLVHADAIKQKTIYSSMVFKGGKYAKYKKYNKVTVEIDASNPHHNADRESDDETEALAEGPPTNTQPASAFGAPASQTNANTSNVSMFGTSTGPQTPTFGSSSFGQPSKVAKPSPFGSSNLGQPPAAKAAFGQPSTPTAFGATGGLGTKSSPWGTPAQSATSKSAFGHASTLGGGATFGQTSKPGIFGQPSQPGGTAGQPAQSKPGPFLGNTGASPFAKFAANPSPFSANANQASSFAAAAQNLSSPFGQKPALSKETSTASTATIGSSNMSSFGQISAFGGSSFASKPAFSKESTMNEESTKKSESNQPVGGLFGLGNGGFKLGSGFTGDGTAKDDLPKPSNAGAGFFGAGFGDSLGGSSKTAEPAIKQEPGTEQRPSLKDIPAATPAKDFGDAPLPPDPSTYKAPKMPDVSEILGTGSKKAEPAEEAPLPPDPSTYKAPKMPDVSAILEFGASKKQEEKDEPIAGSPPLNVTKSQTFSSAEGSEFAGPDEDEEDELENESDDEANDGEEDDSAEEEDSEEREDVSDDGAEGEWEEEEEEQEEEYEVEDQAGLDAFKARMQPPSPKRSGLKTQARTPPSDQKTNLSSYTPAGLPKGPTFPQPVPQAGHSPRSPSPQRRAVTSPVRNQTALPSQIKTSAVPPAKPVQKPLPQPKLREPTAGELEDEAYARVEALLNAPVEPTRELPTFYSHTDYTGSVDKAGIGGQIEKVFRDVNSMIHVVGLNARSLNSFLTGQERLRNPGQRTVNDLEDPETWCLGDLHGLNQVMASLEGQLDAGKLDHVRDTLSELAEEEREVHRVKTRTADMRKHINAQTDPQRLALQETAPLSAETQAQQTELRQGVQRVQELLSEVEEKMTLLRADLAAMSRDQAIGQAPVPTMEAVTNTIQKMTAMVQQKSGDVDLLEAQIKRLPGGVAALQLEDNYEDDLAGRLAGNRLLADSPATPQRRPRMAANGDALGMSAMFGASRFQTPPSGKRSVRFTPEASGFGRSTGSLSGSTRKKMVDVTEEEIEAFQAKAQRRRDVLGALKSRVEANGSRTVKVE